MNQLLAKYQKWRFKNTLLFVLSMVALFYFADSALANYIMQGLKELGLLGVFIVGIFFVSTFTVIPSSIILFHLVENTNAFGFIICAGAGAMLGDYIIFRFLKDRVFEELRPVLQKISRAHPLPVFYTPYFAWLAPVVGALLIATPLPDEIGIGLLGITNLKNWQFLLLSFVLNSVGMLAIVLFASVL